MRNSCVAESCLGQCSSHGFDGVCNENEPIGRDTCGACAAAAVHKYAGCDQWCGSFCIVACKPPQFWLLHWDLRWQYVTDAMAFTSASGFLASVGTPTGGRQPRPYDCSDHELNLWADVHMDDFAQSKLASVDPELRRRSMFITRQKCMNGNCNNPSQYVQGIIRKEMGGPYSAASMPSWQPQSGPQARPPAMFPSLLQTVASPLHAPAAGMQVSRPAAADPAQTPQWVTAAIALHMQRSALFRAVAAHIPAEAMACLSSLPSSFQTACILSMLVSPDHWTKPDQYIAWFVQRSMCMNPPHCPSVSTSNASSCASTNAKRLAVVFLGSISGAEWLGVALGLQCLSEEKRSFDIVERIHVAPPCRWQPVLDEVSQMLSPSAPFSHGSAPEGAQMMAVKAPLWAAQNTTVLVLCFGPQPQATASLTGCVLPGYHGGNSCDLWHYMACIRTLKSYHCAVMVAHLHLTQFEDAQNSGTLTKIFGDPWVMNPASLRVPQHQFTVRCRPSGSHEPSAVRRTLERSSFTENLHGSLVALFSNTAAFDLELPSLTDIENILDKQSLCMQLNETETLALARMSVAEPVGGSKLLGKNRLLNRANLAAVFGLQSWNLNEHWNVKMPCTPMINSVTGIPVNKDNPEAVLCGQLRWCRSCSEYYDALMSTPSPHLVQEVVARLVQDSFFAGIVQRGSITADDLPVHVCTSPCNGLVT